MRRRTLLVTLGSAVTTFLVVAVAVIELLAFEFSALVGVPVGLAAAFVVAAVTASRYDHASPGVRHLADGVAAFGLTTAGLLALRYVNVPGARSVLTFETLLAAAVAAALLAAVGSWWLGRYRTARIRSSKSSR